MRDPPVWMNQSNWFGGVEGVREGRGLGEVEDRWVDRRRE